VVHWPSMHQQPVIAVARIIAWCTGGRSNDTDPDIEFHMYTCSITRNDIQQKQRRRERVNSALKLGLGLDDGKRHLPAVHTRVPQQSLLDVHESKYPPHAAYNTCMLGFLLGAQTLSRHV
jgi:hypothetical protein